MVVAISCLILIFFVIFPQFLSLISAHTAAGELSSKAKFLEVKAQALQNYNEEDLSSKVSYALSAYPEDKDYANALSALQGIASKWGFVITAFALSGGEVKIKGAQSYVIKLDITGSRALLPSFLNEIEISNRLMRVNGLEVSSGRDTAAVESSLTILAFYAPVPTTFGSVDSPLPTLSSEEEEIITKLSSNAPVQLPSEEPQEVIIPTGKANPFE